MPDYLPEPVVPNVFGARDSCAYENLMPDDVRWS